MKRFCALCALSILFFAVFTTLSRRASASPENKTIIFFIPNTNWPPYLMDDPKYGEGVLIDVLKAICKPLGYKVIPKRLPDKRGWLMLETGEVDAHAKAMKWVKSPRAYDWTDPFMDSEDALLLRKDSPLRYEQISDLFGKTVATIKSFVYPPLEPYFQERSITRQNASCPFKMMEMVKLGRVDAAMVNRSETLWLFKNKPGLYRGDFRLSRRNVDQAQYRYVFTKQKLWRPFILEFNRELARMKEDGRLKAIMDKYR